MKNAIGSKTPGPVWLATSWLLVPLLLSFFTGAVYAQWTRLALDEGGVGVDVQLLRLEDNSLDSMVVWSANMEGGVFRSTWSGSSWGTWTEYLLGKFMFGVEAIKVGTTEHVLAATGTLGVWYKQNPTAAGSWARPNGYDYPAAWNTVWTMDAAFYCNTDGTWPQSPEDSFFVILSDTIGQHPNVQFEPGIYRWDAINTRFSRVDAASPTSNPRYFANFWRDLSNPNVLYSIMGQGPGDPPAYSGALCKFSGSYTATSPSFDTVSIVPPEATLKEVCGFNQWDYNGVIYSYALVFWLPSGGSDTYSIFVSRDLANGSPPTFDSLTTVSSAYFSSIEDEWLLMLDSPSGGRIIGKPYVAEEDTCHKLWITTGQENGVLYKDTRDDNLPVQVNGSPSNPIADDLYGLKSWTDRSFTPDPNNLERILK